MKIRHISSIIYIAAALILSGLSALAAIPNPPTNLSDTLTYQPTDNNLWKARLYLLWSYDSSGSQPTKYGIFQTDVNTMDFHLLEEVSVLNSFYHEYEISDLEPGVYHFQITAMNSEGVSAPGNTITVTIGAPFTLHFTNTFPDDVIKSAPGDTYTLQVSAEASNQTPIRYYVSSDAKNITINQNTGLLQWAPQNAYKGYAYVYASPAGYPGAVVQHAIALQSSTCDGESHLTIHIVNTLEQSLPLGTVYLYNINDPKDTSEMYPAQYQQSIQNGIAEFSVEPGTYIAYYSGDNFQARYYQNAISRNEATIITVKCNENVALMDSIASYAPSYTVRGKVTNEDGTVPVWASLTFVQLNKNLPPEQMWEQKRLYGAGTDKGTGSYQVQLPGEFDYIVYADQITADTMTPPPSTCYMRGYYKNCLTPAEAQFLHMTKDFDDINFLLTECPNYENGFSGTVQSPKGNAIASTLIAYNVETYEPKYTESDGNGNYTFSKLIPGTYIVVAQPLEWGHYSWGYYKENAIAVLSWSDATQITVGTDMLPGSYMITLPPLDSTSGGIVVKGHVQIEKGIVIGHKEGEGTLSASPVAAAMIAIVSSTGQVARFNVSASDGFYSLNGLKPGTYTLVVDKIGLQHFTQTIIVKEGSPTVENDIAMAPQSPTDVPTMPTLAQKEIYAYPNPANSLLTVEFAALAGKASITITNTLGMEVYNNAIETVQGSNLCRIQTPFPIGSYLLHIQQFGATRTLSFTVIR